jgi:prepilin-type N-terminal cleavage/methylation domain-containing protein
MDRTNQRGFTLIEVLVVAGVILALIGIAFFGFARVSNASRAQSTQVILQNLANLQAEYERTKKLAFNTPIAAPGAVVDGAADRLAHPAIAQTQQVIGEMMRVPSIRDTLGRSIGEGVLRQTNGTPLDPPVLVDAWNNPIIYVPATGLGNVTVAGQSYNISSAGAYALAGSPPPGARPFWASAGPDGDFSKGDDNVYSFGN